MIEKKEITAIILAGGKSSRMGKDKGLVYLDNKPLIEHITGKLKKFAGHIIIISGNTAYRQFGYPCFEDLVKEKGPLGGIYTGLVNSSSQINLVVGCDMPFLSQNIFSGMINNCEGMDAILAGHKGKAEPLCAIYNKSCIPQFKLLLDQNQLKITNALEGLKTIVISFDNEKWFRGDEFTNINSNEELQKFENNNNNNKINSIE